MPENNDIQQPTPTALAPATGYAANDWQGKPITEKEEPNKIIKVWMIEPHPTDSAYDSCLVRSYQEAVEVMKQTIENTVDMAEEETLANEGVTVKVRLVEMRLDDYEIAISQD